MAMHSLVERAYEGSTPFNFVIDLITNRWGGSYESGLKANWVLC